LSHQSLAIFSKGKLKNEERITRLHFLVGKVSSKFRKKDDDDLVKIWREQKALTENFVNAVLKYGDHSDIAGMEGLFEGLEEERGKLESQAKALEEEVIKLRGKVLATAKKD
jgi:hypothetical protein